MEVLITRIFDAPRDRVWQTWVNPDQMKQWWGPKGFTCPVAQIDFRVGGINLLCMRSPEGKDYWSTGMYREITPLEKIICTDSFADAEGNLVPASHYDMPGNWPLALLITVLFEDVEGRTKLTLKQVGLPDQLTVDQSTSGWNESFDKLADSLK